MFVSYYLLTMLLLAAFSAGALFGVACPRPALLRGCGVVFVLGNMVAGFLFALYPY